MTNVAPVIVQNRDGLLGVLEHPESLRVGSEARIAVRLTSGQVVLVPVDLMVQQGDGSFHLDLDAAEVARLETDGSGPVPAREGHEVAATRSDDAMVVPVVAEEVEVAKRQVESGRVRIHKAVETTDQVVEDSLVHEVVDVERVPINRIVDGPVGNRQDGDVTVVPVYKEVLVIEKRLMLVEEVRITRRRTEQHFSQVVPIRTETVIVERKSSEGSGEAREIPGRDD